MRFRQSYISAMIGYLYTTSHDTFKPIVLTEHVNDIGAATFVMMEGISSDDEDEQLKLAIALSLQDDTKSRSIGDGEAKNIIDLTEEEEIRPMSSSDTQVIAAPTRSQTTGVGLLELDRKAMEEERLARKRKASISPPFRAKSLKTGIDERNTTHEAISINGLSALEPEQAAFQNPTTIPQNIHRPDGTGLRFPSGVVKKTWSFGFPRQADDIKLEEVLEREDLTLAVLSSFQWDIEWLLKKIDTSTTKMIMVMQAKDDATKQQYVKETADMPNLRLCFPSMEGQINCMHSKLMLLAHPSYLRICCPTANLVPYDWGEKGVMENTVFLIDLPRHPKGYRTRAEDVPHFCQDLIYFCDAMGLQQETIDSLHDFDFSATKDFAFVHTIGGAHTGQAAPWRRTGYCGLGRAVKLLGLDTDQLLNIDFITSSIGAVNIDFFTRLYLAAQGDDGLREYNWRTRRSAKSGGPQKSISRDTTAQEELIKSTEENFRVYFPSQETVLKSRGGAACGGPICFSSKWYNAPTFPRQILRDCESTREGLLMHNKIIYVQAHAPGEPAGRAKCTAWAYIGSANCSESAWGKLVQEKGSKQPKLNCRNWECGVIVPVQSTGARENALGVGTGSENGPNLDSFRGTIPIPIQQPGQRFESRQPWFFAEHR